MAAHENIGRSDEWYTPKYIFDALQCDFDLDVAAPVDRRFCSVPAKRFITENSLATEWKGFIWMNPPWSGRGKKELWLKRFLNHAHGIVLTPDRSSAPWWQIAAKKSDAVLFVNGKIKFVKPDGSTGDSPSTGTTLFATGDRAVRALINAEKNGLGLVFSKSLHNSNQPL